MASKMTQDAIAQLLNNGGSALLGSCEDNDLLSVLTDYFTEHTQEDQDSEGNNANS